jgi:hypothetical protein
MHDGRVRERDKSNPQEHVLFLLFVTHVTSRQEQLMRVVLESRL